MITFAKQFKVATFQLIYCVLKHVRISAQQLLKTPRWSFWSNSWTDLDQCDDRRLPKSCPNFTILAQISKLTTPTTGTSHDEVCVCVCTHMSSVTA